MGSSRPSTATPSSVATTVRPRAHTDTPRTRALTAPLPLRLIAPLRLTVDPRVAAVLYISTTKRKA